MEEHTEAASENRVETFTPWAAIGAVFGGALMGLANIVPGVSGGTMILALGIYEQFVQAVADVTRLKFRFGSIAFLAILGVSALIAIFLCVEPINWGLTHQQHLMFALFIGLSLGGVPLIWRTLQPIRPAGITGISGGLLFMIASTFLLQRLDLPANFFFLFTGGVIGAAAMVLPGISGSYMLLAMGLYFPITEGIHAFKEGLTAMDIAAAWTPALGVLLPVGLGVLVGIAALSNVLKAALERAHDPTMGTLLGLLLGSVVFLYPFREPGHKDPFAEAAPFTPLNVVLVIVFLVCGFATTYAIARFESRNKHKSDT